MGSYISSSSGDGGQEKDFINEKISSSACVVFSKTYCPYCTKAKQAISSTGAKFEVIELNNMSNGSKIQSALAKMTGRRTVPNVFISGKTVGGGDDVEELKRSGKLDTLLQDAGAM
mmetsp:Transcript_31995/g.42219  ORF Transcript_31995/g.42219 Transcript_31995/m.42219 type:complete len:116 (+) Transcript_31995:116-463(+)